MIPVSVVIITKNEAHIIKQTLESIRSLTEDIVIVDSGSTDGTQEIAAGYGAQVIEYGWQGFGKNKNRGIEAARHDWILSIDADEQPDVQLVRALHDVDFSDLSVVYNIRFKTFLGNKLIRYGEWGNDSHVRFFNRKVTRWNDAEVHEKLMLPPDISTRVLSGYILHFTMKDIADYATKMTRYALLNADKYHAQGKKANWVKRNLSPPFSFFQHYILKMGFLDGSEGYLIAKVTAFYTLLKYARLNELNKGPK